LGVDVNDDLRKTGRSISRGFVGAALALAAQLGMAVTALAAAPATPAAPAMPTAPATPAPAKARPSDDELLAITLEGRRIAAYHEAIAAAQKRLEKETDLHDRPHTVVVERGGATHVVFVVRGSKGDEIKGFMLLADAVFVARAHEVAKLDVYDPPKAVPADAQTMLRALEVAHTGSQAQAAVAKPPFNEAIFREKGGTFTVYLQSRTGNRAAWRFGSDLKVKVSGDGNQVLDITPLHGPGEAVDVPPGDGKKPTLHNHVHGDLPTSTDVAMVLENPLLAPHLVMTPAWIMRIEADGALTWLGRNEVPPAVPGGGM
jgi:hypothetical protein